MGPPGFLQLQIRRRGSRQEEHENQREAGKHGVWSNSSGSRPWAGAWVQAGKVQERAVK